jgi:excisionase family DNA binding protein
MDKLLLRPSEVSEMTGIGKSKTYQLISAGVIPAVRVGKSLRVAPDALRRWISELQGNVTDPIGRDGPMKGGPVCKSDPA